MIPKKSHFLIAERLVKLLDTKFTILGVKFGVDPFLDLLPIFGNYVGIALSCYVFGLRIS